MHASFLGIMGVAIWQSQANPGVDKTALLYSFVSGDSVVQGPLDPSAYAQTNPTQSPDARVAAVDTSGVDFITFQDPEVQFSTAVQGSAVVAPLQPEITTPGSPDASVPAGNTSNNANNVVTPDTSSSHSQPFVYTVADGDSIGSIATKFNLKVSTILSANGLNSNDTLHVGDHLTILPTDGVFYTVGSGDTVSEIANKFAVKSSDIIAYNDLGSDAKLSIGDKIIIPGATGQSQQAAPSIAPSNNSEVAQESTPPANNPPHEITSSGWVWPNVTKHISQYFGEHGHTGIDIDNRSYPPIVAAKNGTVQFEGWLGGYGNLIILNNGNGITTYYAHLSKFYVGKGDTVEAGQTIAREGSTGNSTGPHLHFEVRINNKPVNPLGFF